MYEQDWELILLEFFVMLLIFFASWVTVGWLPAMLAISLPLVGYLVWFILCHESIIDDVQTWWECVVQETASDLREWVKEKHEDTAEWAADKLEDVADWANERKSDLRYWLANR